ncbi:MAG: ATP-binding cassette domain-containing protein [Alphaproteobacteria bacterium]
MNTQRPVLELENVNKVFGANAEKTVARLWPDASSKTLLEHGLIAAVRDASFVVSRGEVFVIMGLSGSGKSTLLRCMTTLLNPTSGSIRLDGIDLATAHDKDLVALRREKVSMVFQNFALLPHLSVLQNIAFPLKIRGLGRIQRETQARKMVELVGLNGREAYFPHELSGGQQQRVGIARSLVTEPEVWFLDEPFSALDPLIRHEMQNELIALQNLFQKTIVFITHDFDEAVRIADRIAVMRDGRILQIGTPEELVVNPADAYVTEFIQNIPREKVLSVGSVMGPVNESAVPDNAIQKDKKLIDVAKRLLESDDIVNVVDGNTVVGSIGRANIISVLFRE